eukprot:gene14992-biopygen881
MLPYLNYDRFVLEDMNESECLVDFRFKKDDIYSLAVALRLIEVLKCTNGTVHVCHTLVDMETWFQGQPLSIQGDPAYLQRVHLQCPFARRVVLSPEEQAFNQSMSQVRVSVEWLFGDIVNYFKFTDFKKDLKIGLSAVGKIYVVCAILHNALTCLYSNSTASYFNIQPPTLAQYFNGE